MQTFQRRAIEAISGIFYLIIGISVSYAATPLQFSGLLTDANDYSVGWPSWYTSNGSGVPGTYSGPGYGGQQTDAKWGTTISRAPRPTDCPSASNNTSGDCLTDPEGYITDYAKVVLWSSDGSYFIQQDPRGWLHLYNATTTPYTYIRRLQINPATNMPAQDGSDIYGDESNWTWSRTPGTHLLYYTGRTAANPTNNVALKAYDPVSNTSTLIHDFSPTIAQYPGCVAINNEREGEPSDDDNLWGFTCNLTSDNDQNAALIYNKATDSVISKGYGSGGLCSYRSSGVCFTDAEAASAGAHSSGYFGANYITISPAGDYVLINWNYASHDYNWQKGVGTEVFDLHLNYLGGATSSNNHADVGYDVNGAEVFVQTGDDAYAGGGIPYHIYAVCELSAVTNNGIVGSTSAGGCEHFARMPSSFNWAHGDTISMRATQGAGKGYALLSMYNETSSFAGPGGMGFLENIALKIDWQNLSTDTVSDQVPGSPTPYYRLGRTHSVDAVNDYFAQADGCPDNTFSKFSFTSTMDHVNVTGPNYTQDSELPTGNQGRYGAFYTILAPQSVSSRGLPKPALNLSATLPVNASIAFNYDPSLGGVKFAWSVSRQSGSSGSGSFPTLARGTLGATNGTVNASTPRPALSLGQWPLDPGVYTIAVYATQGSLTSEIASQTVSLVFSDLSNVRVFPNPWRKDKHGAAPVTFDQMGAGSSVKIFSVSGHEVKELDGSASSATWNLTNETGNAVASGIYLYLIKDGQGNKVRGKLAVIR